MSRRVLFINLLLVLICLLLTRRLIRDWSDFKSQNQLSKLKPPAPSGSVESKEPNRSLEPPNYSAIVDHHLFVADRNPTVIEDSAPAQAESLAPKPVLVGTMELDGDEFALMLSGDPDKAGSAYKRIKPGDTLDGYTLVKILDQKVMMRIKETQVEVRLNEPSKLVAREQAPVRTSQTSGPAPASNTSGAGPITAVGAQPQPPQGVRPDTPPPKGYIPAGAVINGKRKVVVQTPFGPMESWEEAK